MSSGSCVPFFEVFHCEGMNVNKIFSYPAAKQYFKKDGGVIFLLSEQQRMSFTLRGDTKIMLNH